MRASKLLVQILVLIPLLLEPACFASGNGMTMYSVPPPSNNGSQNNQNAYGNPYYQAPYGGGYINNGYPGNPYVYGRPGGYYRTPFTTPTGSYGGAGAAFQPFGGGYYGLPYNGANVQLWRANSGYYYPWVAGYTYNTYPIFMVPQGQANPAMVMPPVSVLVGDLNDYLDKAKDKGKVSDPDFLSLTRRANDLLSKEKSLAYEGGGSLDAEQEAEIRRDVDELSGEVARRVRP
jgi:hypothetical protein